MTMQLDDDVSIAPLPIPTELTARYAAAKARRDAAIANSVVLREQLRPTLPDARVLVVDDQQTIADGLADMIHAETGAEVIPVTNAVIALHLAKTAPDGCYSLAIIDLDLGHHSITGVHVAKALPRSVAVILVTGVAPEALEEANVDVSAYRTYEKPLKGDVLSDLIDAVKARLPGGRRERADSIH